MYRIVYGTSHELADTASFIETLNRLDQNRGSEARGFLDPELELTVSRAPGRLDVMGGIADYSGSLVLELPIDEATHVALQRDSRRSLRIVSLQEDPKRDLAFEMPLTDFESGDGPVDYDTARRNFQTDPARRWAAYVAGVFLVLMRERGVTFRDGARILIGSRVPEGKGVSSSAALEVAVMHAVAAAYDIAISPRETALLCQMVENLVVGAPCGVMDQMTAACGEANQLLAMLCQPAELRGMIAIPDEIALWGLDSGERHAITGEDYSSVRVAAFMGCRIISELSGPTIRRATSCEPTGSGGGASWGGYLADLTPSQFEQQYAARLPIAIGGAEFLSRYRCTTDPVTRVDPEHSYAVRAATAHPVYEHYRARLFANLIADADGRPRLDLLGELMYQSHAGYSACGLGSAATDLLVRFVREAGPARGLYGARVTGGGSGGTVAVLGRRDAGPAIAMIVDRYAEETGYPPRVFSGSSPGSAAFGYLRLKNWRTG